MGGIRDNVRRKVYPEVEVDDNLGIGLGSGLVVPMPMTAVVAPVVMVGFDDAGSGFLVGATYVEMIRRRSR